ncbi:MAG: hypothetical protein QOH90_1891 [Actinomycetota bacterium]|nr:hypothetical protein [Actinomycetota bacterium]
MRNAPEDALDRVLSGGDDADPLVNDLAVVAGDLKAMINEHGSPSGSHERVVFVQGMGAQGHSPSPWRFVGPAAVVVSLLALLGFVSHSAIPGQALYPVRRIMSSIGLAESPLHEADRRIGSVEAAVQTAEEVEADWPSEADDLAVRGITGLSLARELLEDVGSPQASTRLEQIEGLEARAKGVIVRVNPDVGDKEEKKIKAKKHTGAKSSDKKNGSEDANKDAQKGSGNGAGDPEASGNEPDATPNEGQHDEGPDGNGQGVDVQGDQPGANVQGNNVNDDTSRRSGSSGGDQRDGSVHDRRQRSDSEGQGAVRRVLQKVLRKKGPDKN